MQIAGAGYVVKSGGYFVLYGPFKINGEHTGNYLFTDCTSYAQNSIFRALNWNLLNKRKLSLVAYKCCRTVHCITQVFANLVACVAQYTFAHTVLRQS
jgi:hypothetical protein